MMSLSRVISVSKYKMGEDVFSTGQVAYLVGCSLRTVGKWMDKGKLKGYRLPLSHDRRVSRKNLVDFLLEHNLTDILERLNRSKTLLIVTSSSNLAIECPDDWEMEWASSLFEAGMFCNPNTPACMILDLSSLDSSECCRVVMTLSHKPKFQRPLLVALAPEDVSNSETYYKSFGFDMVLVRPLDPKKLLEKLT